MTIYYSIEEADNNVTIPEEKIESILVGLDKFVETLIVEAVEFKKKRNRGCRIAFDGYLGIDWNQIVSKVNRESQGKLKIRVYNFLEYYDTNVLNKVVDKALSADKSFGYVYRGRLSKLLKIERVEKLKTEVSKNDKKVDTIVCMGPGSANPTLRRVYDKIYYFDITRETLFNSSEKNPVYFIGSENRIPVHQLMRRFYYVDGPVLDAHKKYILKHTDFYVECNSIENMKVVPKDVFFQRWLNSPLE